MSLQKTHALLCYLKIIVILCCGLSFWSCKNTQVINASKPAEKQYIPPPAIPESFVNLPIILPVEKLNTIANKEIPKLLTHDKEIKIGAGIKVGYEIQRNQNVIIKSQKNGELHFQMPVNIKGSVGLDTPDKIGFEIGGLDLSTDFKKRSLEQTFNIPFPLSFQTKLELTKDWNLNTNLLGRFDWGRAPRYSIAGYNLDFENMVGKSLQNELNSVVDAMEKKIHNYVNLKKRIEPAWQQLNQPIQIAQEPPVWLVLNPKSINFVTGQNIKMDTLRWNLGIITNIQTVVGDKPKIQNISPLPSISNKPSNENKFTVNLPISVSYSHLTQIITQYTKDQTFDAGKYTIKLNQVEVNSDGEKLLIMTDLQAVKKGKKKLTKAKIYLTGVPVYDKVNQMITVGQVDFDLETRKLLLNAADWLAHDFILKKISEVARYSIKEDIEKAKTQIRQTIKEIPLGGYLQLNGTLSDLQFDNLYLSPTQIEVRILANGTMDAKLK